MSHKTIQFELVTPERVVLREEIRQITLPTTSGEVTILPEHIPLVSILKPGVLEVRRPDDSLEIMSVSGGFLEVMKDKIVILADTAERAAELDEQRVEEARQRAEEAKKTAINIDDVEFARIAARLEKELARTHALNRWRKIKGGNRN